MSEEGDRLLHILRETLISEFRSNQPDLTLRQLAVSLQIYLTDEPQTVRGLASYLTVNKSSISRVLKRLGEIDLAYREVDPRDSRSIVVHQTAQGAAIVKRLGMAMAEAAYEERAKRVISGEGSC